MSTKTVIVCDGCGKILEKVQERYGMILKTEDFWNGVDYNYNRISLDFCQGCAKDIKNTLIKIERSL